MQVIVLCNELQKKELVANGVQQNVEIIWATGIQELATYKNANAIIDLLFENVPDRIVQLEQLLPGLVIINSVTDTLAEINQNFVRIGAWPTFLQGSLVEASCVQSDRKEKAEKVLKAFNKNIKWLPDEPGFVTPRVISAIINEAYFALAEGVSTMEEIDTALKLGTAYPYGPFEWSREIGLQNISTLLHKLSSKQKRYTPAELLVQETDRSI